MTRSDERRREQHPRTRAGLLWPTLFTVFTLIALLGLGTWQWQRMHWKADLLETLAQAEEAEPTVMAIVPKSDERAGGTRADGLEALRFRRITVQGTFEHDHEMHVWRPLNSGPAWMVVTPLRLTRAAAIEAGLGDAHATHVLVMRGLVPQAQKSSSLRADGQLSGSVSVTGRVRLDDPNTWANPPNIDKNQWYTRDLTAMTAHLTSVMSGSLAPAPFFLEAVAVQGGNGAPVPRLTALKLSNRHLAYALTWWGLAATLVGVYIAFVFSRLGRARA